MTVRRLPVLIDQPTTDSRLRWAGIFALIAGACLVAYWPALRGGFIWDDDAHVTKPELRSIFGLWQIWFKFGATQQYYPLLHSLFWVEHLLWGDNALGYHLVNVLMHAGVATLVYAVLRELNIPGAILAAGIFALHPVHVESVAWITEQKNTLSAVFYLSAMLLYLRYDQTTQTSTYVRATVLFVLGLLSKTVTATLPAALLVIFWWKRGKLSWERDVQPLLQWFVLALFAGVVTAIVERRLIGAEGAGFELSIAQRGLIAGRVIWFYLYKLLWPANLIFFYPRWEPDPSIGWQWLFPLAAVLAIAVLWAIRSRVRAPLAAALFFIGTLVPVLGFFNVYPFLFSFVADHFQYLASLGVIVLVSAGIALGLARLPATARRAGYALSGVLVATLAVLSWRQSRMYGDVFTLYRTTIERNPSCWMAYNNLGFMLLNSERPKEAVEYCQEALRLRPKYPEAHYNLGNALLAVGQVQDAIAQYIEALRIKPDYAAVHNNYGIAMAQTGHIREAIELYKQGLKYEPGNPEIHINLGNALIIAGRQTEAIEQFQDALRISPDHAAACVGMASALQNLGKVDESLSYATQALRIDPKFAMAHNIYGNGVLAKGQIDQAIAHYQYALKLKPDFALAQQNLGIALMQAGRSEQGIENLQEAVRLDPQIPEAHFNLGQALAVAGRFNEAIEEYERALRLKPAYADPHFGLARAYAAMNQADAAIAAAEKAVELAQAGGRPDSAREMQAWLNSYRASLHAPTQTPK